MITLIPCLRREWGGGKSRWALQKEMKLFINSSLFLSCFSIRTISGLVALLYGLYVIGLKFFGSGEPAGWTALMVMLLFVAAFQMIALGVIGGYVWRGLDATRHRPMYVVRQVNEPAAPNPITS